MDKKKSGMDINYTVINHIDADFDNKYPLRDIYYQ
jgi:hypothetical protein